MKPLSAHAQIIVMRGYLQQLTAAADASVPNGYGWVLADTVRMYTSAAMEVSKEHTPTEHSHSAHPVDSGSSG